ncbi:hypothetical protein JGU66_09005 [Myxococcaceae bacterium JPH2]|nr:hypothetical protein [Myxococcaceae bacterium JPH2]
MAASSAGPSVMARLLLVVLGVAFLGAAWAWSQREHNPTAGRLVEAARRWSP